MTMLDVILEHEQIFARQAWLNALPIMDEPTTELWLTVCENTAMGELIEIGAHRVVYVVTDGGNVSTENWWVIDADGKPFAYFRDIESINEFLEA
jgi:hypothetical protein